MEYELLRASQKLALHKECLPYERQVYIFAYKNAEFLKELQAAILDINIEILFPGGGTVRDIRTAKIDDLQRKDTSYDFIGGVQIIDVNFRVFILESCSNGALHQLGARFPKANQNSDAFKIIRNEKLSFYKRMYLDFNIDTKRVKLRKSIKRLVGMPDIYLRERVPIEIYNTIMKVKRLREKWTLEDIISSNLWLTGEELVVLERNYGDALNDFDLTGNLGKLVKNRRGNKKSERRASAESRTQGSIDESAAEDTQASQKIMTMHQIRESYQSINNLAKFFGTTKPDSDSGKNMSTLGREADSAVEEKTSLHKNSNIFGSTAGGSHLKTGNINSDLKDQ
jgi:hypothetical protein